MDYLQSTHNFRLSALIFPLKTIILSRKSNSGFFYGYTPTRRLLLDQIQALCHHRTAHVPDHDYWHSTRHYFFELKFLGIAKLPQAEVIF